MDSRMLGNDRRGQGHSLKNFRNSGKALGSALVVVAVAIAAYSLAQVSPVIRKPNDTIRALNDPMFILKGRVDDLEKLTGELVAKLKKSEEKAAAQQKELTELKDANRPPKGYTTMFITKTNFNNVEGSALMKFFVRY